MIPPVFSMRFMENSTPIVAVEGQIVNAAKKVCDFFFSACAWQRKKWYNSIYTGTIILFTAGGGGAIIKLEWF